ncbi:hypothetical protein HDU84_007369 [Entophlyctis sp. JEL0112]|nr:hypothetical protein HDU84_007369 [Entophlyctis sp. JEL0112]
MRDNNNLTRLRSAVDAMTPQLQHHPRMPLPPLVQEQVLLWLPVDRALHCLALVSPDLAWCSRLLTRDMPFARAHLRRHCERFPHERAALAALAHPALWRALSATYRAALLLLVVALPHPSRRLARHLPAVHDLGAPLPDARLLE